MNKINYQIKLDNTIKEITQQKKVPKLLIHSCCAPCSSYVLEYLSDFFNITVLYYNPNIFPSEEYQYRIDEQKKLIDNMKTKYPIDFEWTDYTPNDFYSKIKGLEKEPEGGQRCYNCFKLRLEYCAIYAKENNFDYFTTTLSISPLKNSEILNSIGMDMENKYDIPYLLSDFKKRNGYKRSVELSKEFDLYRQDYCGCVYSKAEQENRKNS